MRDQQSKAVYVRPGLAVQWSLHDFFFFFQSHISFLRLSFIQILSSLIIHQGHQNLHWNTPGCSHCINLLVLVIRNECQILLGVSSYQVIEIVFFSEVTLDKIARQAKFIFGNIPSPVSYTFLLCLQVSPALIIYALISSLQEQLLIRKMVNSWTNSH